MRNSEPLVSIFMPSYNAENFIKEALESAINQNYSNIEIVISDDDSSDKTSDILRGYQEKYPDKIKLFLQGKNLGVTKNCNFILKHCLGEYICFFAGDDVLKENCISEQLKICIQEKVEIVFHNQFLINEYGNILPEKFRFKSHRGTIENFLRKGIYARANGMLVKSSAIPESGFDEAQAIASDFDFILRILSSKNSFYYTDKKLSLYRRHSLSLTATSGMECRFDNLQAYVNTLVSNPNHARFVKSVISKYYVGMRKLNINNTNYSNWLINALAYDRLNYRAWIGLIVYMATFGKIKL